MLTASAEDVDVSILADRVRSAKVELLSALEARREAAAALDVADKKVHVTRYHFNASRGALLHAADGDDDVVLWP